MTDQKGKREFADSAPNQIRSGIMVLFINLDADKGNRSRVREGLFPREIAYGLGVYEPNKKKIGDFRWLNQYRDKNLRNLPLAKIALSKNQRQLLDHYLRRLVGGGVLSKRNRRYVMGPHFNAPPDLYDRILRNEIGKCGGAADFRGFGGCKESAAEVANRLMATANRFKKDLHIPGDEIFSPPSIYVFGHSHFRQLGIPKELQGSIIETAGEIEKKIGDEAIKRVKKNIMDNAKRRLKKEKANWKDVNWKDIYEEIKKYPYAPIIAVNPNICVLDRLIKSLQEAMEKNLPKGVKCVKL